VRHQEFERCEDDDEDTSLSEKFPEHAPDLLLDGSVILASGATVVPWRASHDGGSVEEISVGVYGPQRDAAETAIRCGRRD
jgi:hypothetical protein